MRQNYERLAWVVLLLAFATCVGLAIGVPWSIQWYLSTAYTGEFATLDVQEPGNLLVTCPGDTNAAGIVGRKDNLCEGREGALISALNDNGLLTIRPRTTSTATLVTVQLYPGARLIVEQARAPRFSSFSSEPHKVVLRLENGSVRVGISSQLARPLRLEVYTPQALIKLTEGSTSVEVNNQESQIVVREGQAIVVALANNTTAQVNKAQRVIVPKGNGVTDVMPAERNLLAGYSDFRQPLGSVWKSYTKDLQYPEESPGLASNVTAEGLQVVDFARIGTGHAETGIYQEINRDIGDFRSLYLHVRLRVLQQDVPVCGTLGTECPVMVRIDYIDESGTPRNWQQGFYSTPDPNGVNPEFCVLCDPRNLHRHITNGVWYPFDPPNLIPLLEQVGPPPVKLKSIWIYASGHTYQSQVSEVQLLGE